MKTQRNYFWTGLVTVLFLLNLVVLILVIWTYISLRKKKKDDFTSLVPQFTDDLWDLSPIFNETNYILCDKLIQYLYTQFRLSKTTTLSTATIAGDLLREFHLENIRLHTALDNYIHFVGNSQYLIACTGRIRGTRTGVVVIRGTQTFQEWKTDLYTIFTPIDLHSFQQKIGFSDITFLPHVDHTQLPPGTKVARGWYDYYCRQWTGTIHDCYCSVPSGNKCKVIAKEYSRIDQECKPDAFGIDRIDPGKTNVTLASTIWEAVRDLDVDNVIITGHSLGAAMATLCGFHLALSFGPAVIHSMYTFATPELGNQTFATLYNHLIQTHYRINNSKDIVGLLTSELIERGWEKYLPYPWLKKLDPLQKSHLETFTPVGIEKTFTITDGSDHGWKEGDYHDLQKDYLDQGVKYLFPS